MSEKEKKVVEEEPKEYETALGAALANAFDKADEKASPESADEPKAVKADDAEPETEEVVEEKDTTQDAEDAEDKQSAADADEAEEDGESKLDLPKDWSDEERTQFSKLDREAQEFVLNKSKQLEAGTQRKFQELAEQRKRYEPLEQILRPYHERLQRSSSSRVASPR